MATAKTAPATPALQLLDLDPNQLVLPIDGNVRKDTQLDPDFLKSIKERGVLIPILVIPNEDGGHDVFDGQRRTLGAVAAGHKMIPAIVTSSREEADRISDQIIVNDHRAAITDVDHVAAYQQLALIGLPASAIAKRVSRSVDVVNQALTVAGNPVASTALQSYQITLAQAATIAELSDDEKAVHDLTETAAKHPEKFDHVAKYHRDRIALAANVAAKHAQLAEDGTTDLGDVKSWTWFLEKDDVEWIRIGELAFKATPTVELTLEDVQGFGADFAAGVSTGYADAPNDYTEVAKLQYYVANREQHDIVRKQRSDTIPPTPAQIEAEAERRREEDARTKLRADWANAAEIRRTWISEFLERPTPPNDAIIYVAWAETYASYRNGVDRDVLEWLDIPTGGRSVDEQAARAALSARPKLAMTFVLACSLVALEDDSAAAISNHWQREELLEPTIFHLEQLRSWGYGLSDTEQAYITAGKEELAAIAAEAGLDNDEPTEDDGDDE